MIGSPIATATWDGVASAYYVGLGNGEMVWLIVSMALCIFALVSGSRHEKAAYRKLRR